MVEDIKELAFYPELYMLGHREPFCEIKVIPDEIRTAQRIAAEVSELAMLGVVAAEALSGTGINGRDEGIRIEPLDRARLSHARQLDDERRAERRERDSRIVARCLAQCHFRSLNKAY